MPEGEGDRRGRHTRLLCNVIHRNSCHKTSLSALMHGTHTRSQNHSFSGLLTGIRGAEEKKPGVERISMPLRETWESDGNQGWKDGVPGSQAPRESRKEEGNTGNKKALPGTRMGSAGRTGRRNKRFGDKKWGSRSRMLDGNPQHVKRRRATLPHPLECSTIAAPGLSYRVRNGTGRLTRAMTTAKPRSRNDNQNKATIPAIML